VAWVTLFYLKEEWYNEKDSIIYFFDYSFFCIFLVSCDKTPEAVPLSNNETSETKDTDDSNKKEDEVDDSNVNTGESTDNKDNEDSKKEEESQSTYNDDIPWGPLH